jgi:hypothetical protein
MRTKKKPATRKRKSLLDLRGKIQFAPGYDYKSLRSHQPRSSSTHSS